MRGRGEKTESLFGKGGSGNHGFPIYKGYNRIDISYSKFSNNSNDLNELNELSKTSQDDFGVFIGVLRSFTLIYGVFISESGEFSTKFSTFSTMERVDG